jgi:hypothetical protein
MKYGMFTEEGNYRVHRIVQSARREGWSWTQTANYLEILAKHVPECREASDTVVRESVYSAVMGEYA